MTIAEDGHLIQPVFDHVRGSVLAKEIGISNATTFPGFCSTHERLFDDFERSRRIQTDSHAYRQVYRIACRELFRTRFIVDQHDWFFEGYTRARDEGLLRLVRERAEAAGLCKDADWRSITYEGDPLLSWANERIEPVRRLSRHVEDVLIPALERVVFDGEGDEIYVFAAEIDIELPVALAGAASFFTGTADAHKEVKTLINVVPSSGSTFFALGTSMSNKNDLDTYMAHWMRHALSILSMIESWMINGSDQWWLKPSVWSSLSAERQTRLLQAIMDATQNIGEERDLSIFDAIRTTLIAMSDAANTGVETPEYLRFVASQKAKMI